MKSFVYRLSDPKTNQIFYIGKGTGYRHKSHLKPSMWKNPKNTTNPFLYFKIKSLMENNTPPIITILKDSLTDLEAYELESKLIKDYGRKFIDDGKLFNISDFMGGSLSGIEKPWNLERKEYHKKRCKKNRIYDPTFDELHNEYVQQGKTRKEIASENNCSEILVKKRLEEFKIKKPKSIRYPFKNEYVCNYCNKKFKTPNSVKSRKYCSRKCYFESRYG